VMAESSAPGSCAGLALEVLTIAELGVKAA
jgi:hypothetical protein